MLRLAGVVWWIVRLGDRTAAVRGFGDEIIWGWKPFTETPKVVRGVSIDRSGDGAVLLGALLARACANIAKQCELCPCYYLCQM